MWSWHVSTVVVGGDGALDGSGPLVRAYGRRVLVVTDPAVRAGSDLVDQACRVLAAAGLSVEQTDVLSGAPTLDGARWLLGRQRAAGADTIVAIGGGSVLDPAKVAAAASRHAELLDAATWAGGGLVEPDLPVVRRSLPIVAIPTTVGTGSEVSASASIVVDGAKKLLVHPAVRPTVAVLDPNATASAPRRIMVEGAFEIFLRALGQHIGEGGGRPLQDGMAVGLARAVMVDGDLISSRAGAVQADEAAARHRLALASAATHASWALCGRHRFAHRLWYLANEWAPALGVTKVAATAALAGPYLDALQTGSLPGATAADIGLLADALFGPDVPFAAGVRALMSRWGLPQSLAGLGARPTTVDDVCRQTWQAWGPPSPALAGLTAIDIAALYRAALKTATANHNERR
jgi:NADP-dependent alcohol dehydrogenase